MATSPMNTGLSLTWENVDAKYGTATIDIPSDFEELHIRVIDPNTRISFVFHVIPNDIAPSYTQTIRQGYYLAPSVCAQCIVKLDGTNNKINLDTLI